MAFLTYPRFILFARTFLVPGLMLMQAETILSSTLFLSGWLGPNTFYKSIKVGSPEKAGIKPTTSRPCANSANHMSNHHRSQLSLRPMPSYYIDLMGAIFSYSSCFNSYVTLVYQAGCQVQQKKGTFFSIFVEARKKDTGVDFLGWSAVKRKLEKNIVYNLTVTENPRAALIMNSADLDGQLGRCCFNN